MHKLSDIRDKLTVQPVTDGEELKDVFLLRALCFMERGLKKEQAFDGNDYQATHLLVKHDGEPVGASRLRWFNNFAKVERSCLLAAYRTTEIMRFCFDAGHELAARKGYSRVITHAELRFAKLWKRKFGFERIKGKAPYTYDGLDEPVVEMVKVLEPSDNVISEHSHPLTLNKVEGHWERHHGH